MIPLVRLQTASLLNQNLGSYTLPLFLKEECADMVAVIDDWLRKCASDGLTKCAMSFETLELAHDPASAKHKSELMKFVRLIQGKQQQQQANRNAKTGELIAKQNVQQQIRHVCELKNLYIMILTEPKN